MSGNTIVGGGLPQKQALYDPAFEHDACGVGFIADLHSCASHATVSDALTLLEGLEHRVATGCESETGDGAGILTAMPHSFMNAICQECFNHEGLVPGSYAVGNVFLPKDESSRAIAKQWFERAVATSLTPLNIIGWRPVPVNSDPLGASSRSVEPCVEQVFVGAGSEIDQKTFEAALFVCRKRAENQVSASGHHIYFISLSSKVICWKGMLTCKQLGTYFPDLMDPRYETHVAMVHSRFSTNTFPAWSRAHPYRYICHNGEINTLRGNKNWMRAREGVFENHALGPQLHNAVLSLSQTSRTLRHWIMFWSCSLLLAQLARGHCYDGAWCMAKQPCYVQQHTVYVPVLQCSHGTVGWACTHCIHRW